MSRNIRKFAVKDAGELIYKDMKRLIEKKPDGNVKKFGRG